MTNTGLDSKLHALTDAKGRDAARRYDADWFRNVLIDRKIRPCTPSRKNHMAVIPHAAILYKSRHKIENMFARLKDWRRVETRYDRCADLFLSACTLAAVVMFWL